MATFVAITVVQPHDQAWIGSGIFAVILYTACYYTISLLAREYRLQ